MTKSLTSLFDCSEERLKEIVSDALAGADDGELYLEHSRDRRGWSSTTAG